MLNLFYYVTVVAAFFIMDLVSLDRKYPAIELDMTNFMEHLSDEYICGSVDARDDGLRPDTNVIDRKTGDHTNFENTSSISESEFKQEDEVRISETRFVLFL